MLKKGGCKYNRPKQLPNENLVYHFYQGIGHYHHYNLVKLKYHFQIVLELQ